MIRFCTILHYVFCSIIIMYETSFNKDCNQAAVTESNAYDDDAAVILG